ncbi:MAG TPA: type II secretion system F family protein [Chloroflexia bacterium]|nr:type II secretion system F family protein [Chloroflexia bacterium]
MLLLMLALFTGVGMMFLWSSLTTTRSTIQPGENELESEFDNETETLQDTGLLSRLARRLGLESKQVQKALLIGIPGALAGGLIANVVWGWPVLIFAGLMAGGITPLWYMAGRQAKARLAFQEDLASAIDTLRTLLQFGGLGLTGAIAALAERGPQRLRSEFRTIYEDASLYGLEQALRLSQSRLSDPQFDLVALALITADRAGSRVGGVLDNLSRTIRANLSIMRQIQAEQVKQVLSARLVAILPLGIITLLKLTGSDYTTTFDTALGQIVLVIALGLMLTGYVMMRALSGLPRERRTFK